MDTTRRGTMTAAIAAATAGLPRIAAAQAREVIIGTWGGDYGNLLQENIDRPLAVIRCASEWQRPHVAAT